MDRKIRKLVKRFLYQLKDKNQPELARTGFMVNRDTRNYDYQTFNRDEFEKLPTIWIFGEENVTLFHEICRELRNDLNLEHLDFQELTTEFWNFLFDFYSTGGNFGEINKATAAFYERIQKPLTWWKVYFPLEKFESTFDIEISPFKIVRDYVTNETPLKYKELVRTPEILEWPAVKISIRANNGYSAFVKAKKRFIEFSAMVNIAHRQSTFSGWCNIPLPDYAFIYYDDFNYFLPKFIPQKVIKGCPLGDKALFLKTIEDFGSIVSKDEKERNDVEKRIFRAMEWFFKAKNSDDLSIKIGCYFFALESLLTTKADRFKGEALIIRINLLSMRLSGYHRIPNNFFWMYLLRSDLVHGSEDPSILEPKVKISPLDHIQFASDFIRPLEHEIRQVILYYLQLLKEIRPKKLQDVIKWLEARDETFNFLYEFIRDHYPHKTLLDFLEKNYSDS
ncbi:MAG: hypothetical protein ACFFDI_00690 [Promethearchaeota archaeon]